MLKYCLKFAVIIITTFFVTQAQAIETTAKQAFLIDATTNQVLFAKDADEKMAPSSMSKLMTIYVVFEALKTGELKLTDTMMVSKNAWQMQGTKMFVPVGEPVIVEDLIRGVIVQSGNDACVVLAEGMSGTEEEFAVRLNNKAKALGLNNSNLANATGWPNPEHYMSPRDLAILSQRLINDFPEYYSYFAETEFTYNNITQGNRNTLLTKNVGVDGLKTGHADEAGYGIVISAMRGDRRLILVVNGLKNEAERSKEALSLLNYGFMNFSNVTIAKANDPLVTADVWLGNADKVKLVAKQDIIVTVPVDQKKSIKAVATYLSPVYAPISSEQTLGTLNVQINEENKAFQLYTNQDIEKLSFFERIIAWLKYFFSNWNFTSPQQQEMTQIIY
jgi:D-alanyl-D-alanine carboxypeptidase (penicillin-binding protein 5/6)